MRNLLLGSLSLIALAGCAERDNPWDPANREPQATIRRIPTPGPGVKVILPDSSSRDPDNPYFANLQSALVQVEAGDTVWVQGGRSYALSSTLELRGGGRRFLPLVIRSFGGEARLVDASPAGLASLMDLTGPGYVEIRGMAFVRSAGAGFRANGLQGPLRMDSCRFDSNATWGLVTVSLQAELVLRDLSFRANGKRPALSVEAGADSANVLQF